MALGKKTGGRKKGTPNKVTGLLKDAIVQAATNAGDSEDGLIAYLERQARENPTPFLGLLGKVLPMQVGGDPDNPIEMIQRIERTIVRPKNTNR